jgi:hypothetical protein
MVVRSAHRCAACLIYVGDSGACRSVELHAVVAVAESFVAVLLVLCLIVLL